MTKGVRLKDARLHITSLICIIENLVYLYNQLVWSFKKNTFFIYRLFASKMHPSRGGSRSTTD